MQGADPLKVVAMPGQHPPVAIEIPAMRRSVSAERSPPRDPAVVHESWVDAARLLAAFLIVSVHVLNLDRRFQELPVGSHAWIAVDFLTAATRWALPLFVMVSGYFLLDPGRELDWQTYYARRVRRILWPLLAWTLLYLAIVACDAALAGRPVPIAAMLTMVIKGTPYYHLWYLYMIPGLYLVAPFVKLATDRMSAGQLHAATALCFAVTVFSAAIDGLWSVPNATYIDDFPRYLGYFLAGHLLGRVWRPKAAPSVAVLLISILLAAGLAWTVALTLSPARALRVFGFGDPAVIAMSLAAFVLTRRLAVAVSYRVWLAQAGNASLGIYLVHPAILDVLRHWSYPNAVPVLASQVIAVFLASVLVVLGVQQVPALRRIV